MRANLTRLVFAAALVAALFGGGIESHIWP